MPLHHLPPLQSREHAARHAAPVFAASAERAFDSGELLKGEREILIRHGGQLYRLRHTRNDKLILTK